MKDLIRKSLLWTLDKTSRRKVGRRVICLHEVKSRERFKARMIWLKRNYYVQSLQSLVANSSRTPFKYSLVSLTFDDGHESWFENVVPVLMELDIPATFFVNETRMDLNLFHTHPYRYLWEVGGHTRSHINLGQVIHKGTLDSEIESRRYFAFPYGMARHINPSVLLHLEEHQKIEYAFTSRPGWITKDSCRYYMSRDSLSLDDPEWLWRSRLNGNYDWFYRRAHK